MARKPRKLAAADLQDRALHYLGRYAASTRRLRPVLTRRRLPCLLTAPAFAERKARSLNRRGGSRRQIAAKLAASGVKRDEGARALAALEAEMPTAEFDAALAYARRRRLGAFRAVPDDTP